MINCLATIFSVLCIFIVIYGAIVGTCFLIDEIFYWKMKLSWTMCIIIMFLACGIVVSSILGAVYCLVMWVGMP